MHYQTLLTTFLIFIVTCNCACLHSCTNQGQAVDDTALCLSLLNKERSQLASGVATAEGQDKAVILRKMLELGMWDEALTLITEDLTLDDNDRNTLMAQYYILNNRYREAENEIDSVLQRSPGHLPALTLRAQLLIEAWKLDEAIELSRSLAEAHPEDLDAPLLLGKALILDRRYEEAGAHVARLHQQFPNNGKVYQLEADIHFWNLHPEEAEPLLKKSLQLEPFDADARFSYGYAIWRRIDATQLDQMAAQWELALAVNPRHFRTHWHWGNGHTNLTFVDYADPDEEAIRNALAAADSLFSANLADEAIALTRRVEAEYPHSALPLMHRASLWYADFDHPLRSERLDSAAALFGEILRRKPHYGPAHNGLAAVIKSQRIPYLSTYDSITAVLRATRIDNPEAFTKVFPDAAYYPGKMAAAMAWNQLYTAIAYFPLLARQDRAFVIPPLHKDLAIAMQSPYFRYATTFDNRQWMDIRGVGSGAAAIEYVERGAYGERNVILHEYVHLFHDAVLTDYQNRRIRALYYNAMENGLTLDYYSQNNEHEYLAQTYPAYFEPMKVHPLDFKSMNTTSALREKDPDMYAFLDSLISGERRALAGDRQALASNRAQVYINLSRRQTDPARAAALLDTAIACDPAYQPAHLAVARLEISRGNHDDALRAIRRSQEIDSTYAPTYQACSEWVSRTNDLPDSSLSKQVAWMDKALSLETDLQTRAAMTQHLRRIYADHAQVDEAVARMEDYVQTAPEVSTYLRDRKDDARMYIAFSRAMAGDRASLDSMQRIVERKPHNYSYAADYADALAANGRNDRAIALIEKAQRIFRSNRNPRADFDLRIAEYHLAAGRKDSANVYYDLCRNNSPEKMNDEDRQRRYRLALRLNTGEDLHEIDSVVGYPEHTLTHVASSLHTMAVRAESQGDTAKALDHYQRSYKLNPHALPVLQSIRNLGAEPEECAK
jgi:tetratricopeptide (TPR) repeat protein